MTKTKHKTETESKPISYTKELYVYAKREMLQTIVSKEDSNQVFAKINNNNHVETINLKSSKARSWLMFNHRKKTDLLFSLDNYKSALEFIQADAIYNGAVREKIHNRIAQTDKGIYYDLGGPAWNILRVTKQNYIILPYSVSTPVFRRTQAMVEQVRPWQTIENALEELSILLRISEKERHLFKVHVIHKFFSELQTPMMIIIGEQGSMKTTRTKAIKKIVDPSLSNIGSLPTKKEDIPNTFSNKYEVVFDNISNFSRDTADLFCKAVSGEEISRRQLFTDNDEYIMQYKRKIILNGISPNLEYPDFNRRAIYYDTAYIPEDQLISDSEFWIKFDKLLPSILHEIFTAISRTLATFDKIGAEIKPISTMGDFEKYGETISQALGYKPNSFLKSYNKRIQLGALVGIDSWPIIRLIDKMMEGNDNFRDYVSALHKKLKETAKDQGIETKGKDSNWPQLPQHLTRQINQLKEQFRKLGYKIEIYQYHKNDGKFKKNYSVIEISRTPLFSKPPLPSLPSFFE